MKYVKDQLVYFEYDGFNRHNSGIQLRVVKVGKKWASLAIPDRPTDIRFKVDINDDRADGGQYSSPGRAWASEEECLAYRKLQSDWGNLYNRLTHSLPKGMTQETLSKIRELLGL